MTQVKVRIYGQLRDFLPKPQREGLLLVRFPGTRSVKDLIESLGVPHPEIDLVLVNGEPASFEHLVRDGDRIAAYPKFHDIDISNITRVRPRRPQAIRFVLDGHLGRLTRRMRLLGLDALCPAGADDGALAEVASREDRVLLTRDRGLLKRRSVAHGYCVRETRVHAQLVEVLRHFGPLALNPFTRCLECNALLLEVPKSTVARDLPGRTADLFDHFFSCRGCGKIYWQGSHWTRLRQMVDAALSEAGMTGGTPRVM